MPLAFIICLLDYMFMTTELPQDSTEVSIKPTPISTKLGETGLKICVFCSANELKDSYTKPAEEFARLIGENGHSLVWGGSDSGLMKVVASGAQEAGAKIFGVSVEFLKSKARKNADEMIITSDLGERKAMMLDRSDVIVMMVGGLGTLDEAAEILEHKKHGHHDKPIIILNSNGFYDGLQQQLQRMDSDGFLPGKLEDYVHFANTPASAMDYINTLPVTQ